MSLSHGHQVNLVNATHSTNESSSASVGISYGTRGWGVDASMAKAHGDGNSDAVMQNSTHVSGANSVSIVLGGGTNLIGADVSGRQVSADIGGNLNIASVQDTTVSNAHQESTGGGFSISQGGGGGSFSHTNANANSSYAGVNEQAGIQAGNGGFNVNVKGNTDLKGAVIASDADASKNTLTTGTLTYSDIANSSSYDAHSGGFSAGASVGAPGKGLGTSSVGNAGGVTPMLSQNDSGNDSATSRSGVSAGTISVTDGAHQTQDVTGLNRDTSDANGTVTKTPDVNNLLDRQADMMGAASAAGEAVTTQSGVIADAKRNAAQQAAKDAAAAGNPDLAAQYNAEAAQWDEGGTYRVLMHTAGGALVPGLGGGSAGSAAGGAIGAGTAAALAGRLNAFADGLSNGNGEGADPGLTAGNVAANILAGGIGGLVGGNSGAFAAADADLYNRSNGNGDGKGGTGSQLLAKVTDWAKDTYGDIPGTLSRWGNQITGQANADASAKISQSPTDLIAQGTANGINAVIGTKGGEPPMANPGTVLADSTTGAAAGTPGYVPDNATLASSGNDNRLPIPETVTADNGLDVKSNSKHTPGMPGNNPSAGTEPRNSLDLFNSSVPGGDDVRYAIDSSGNINRFSSDGNGVFHWSGSTGDSSVPLNVSNIPIAVKRSLGFKGK